MSTFQRTVCEIFKSLSFNHIFSVRALSMRRRGIIHPAWHIIWIYASFAGLFPDNINQHLIHPTSSDSFNVMWLKGVGGVWRTPNSSVFDRIIGCYNLTFPNGIRAITLHNSNNLFDLSSIIYIDDSWSSVYLWNLFSGLKLLYNFFFTGYRGKINACKTVWKTHFVSKLSDFISVLKSLCLKKFNIH